MSAVKKHYHWIVAVVMLLELAVIGGLANNYSGLFILPITQELEIPRASFSLAFCLKYLFSFLGTLFSGVLRRRLCSAASEHQCGAAGCWQHSVGIG